MNKEEICNIIKTQQEFFQSGATKDAEFRINQLNKLSTAIKEYETEIIEALGKDLGRHQIDSYLGDIAPLEKSIKFQVKNLRKWVNPNFVKSMPGGKSFIKAEPLGDVLIIAPWNYPFFLLMDPLVGAISAGNCAVLKPSEITVNTAKVINKIISKIYAPEYVKVIEGGVEQTKILLEQKFDYIFFTGSTTVGKIVYEAAAKNLTPVTLELGGKSPVIVDSYTDLKITANRIIWGKLFNNGQTCTSPDYLFVDKKIKDKFVEELKNSIRNFYGENPQKSQYYSRVVNQKNFDRLNEYLKDVEIIFGGKTDREDLYIEPTLVYNPPKNSKIMQEEIFGPILPIMEYENVSDVIKFINNRPKPLALYVFTKNKKFYQNIVDKTTAGGMSINDTIMHVASEYLPFGGVGDSGIGKYHGKASFDTFSNYKSIFKNTFLFDRNILYAPYKLCLKYTKKLVKLL